MLESNWELSVSEIRTLGEKLSYLVESGKVTDSELLMLRNKLRELFLSA